METLRNSLLGLAIVAAIFVVGLGSLVLVPIIGEGKVPDADQRPGLVSTAVTMEDTGTHYDSGAEFVQAVYASQGITISTDINSDSYSTVSPLNGDIVVGADYVGIRIDETTAIGIDNDGGSAQIMRITNEDIRRVDW